MCEKMRDGGGGSPQMLLLSWQLAASIDFSALTKKKGGPGGGGLRGSRLLLIHIQGSHLEGRTRGGRCCVAVLCSAGSTAHHVYRR